MDINNTTNYSTRQLRKIFLACEKNEGTDPNGRNVKVVYRKNGGHGGCAWYHTKNVIMKLPHPHRHNKKLADIHTVAQIYIHEVGHNLGLKHSEMDTKKIWEWDIPFLDAGTVEFNEPKPKPEPKPKVAAIAIPKKSAAVRNEEKARQKLAEWTKKMSRAKNLVKKYQKKVKYYDKKKEMAINVREE